MRPLLVLLPLVIALPAAAQPVDSSEPHSSAASNIAPGDTRSPIAPSLPSPDVSPNSRPSDYLRAARGALATGRTGEAQQALEMAESRMLDRSVPLGQTGIPSSNPTVGQITGALQALASNDRAGCMKMIETAIASATAQGL